MYQLWVFVHLVGVFGFLLAHGVAAAVALSLRRERDPQKVRALLELSSWTLGAFYVSTLVLLAGGITAGFLGHWWGEGWIWAALGVLVLMMGAMYGLASTYYRRVRQAVGLPASGRAPRPGETAGPQVQTLELEPLLRSSRPLLSVWVGIAGLLLILWLMVFKPF
jgi:formate hydrogenlyase subunit 3/multisubunit Na+/H+ antiporter MnhD subunit